MIGDLPAPPAFWSTVGLLLRASRKRAAGRRNRQRELLQTRSKAGSTDWSALGFAAAVFFMAIINGGAAFILNLTVKSGQQFEAEHSGKIVVSRYFYDAVESAIRYPEEKGPTLHRYYYSSEAREIVERDGGSRSAIEQKLAEAFRLHGDRDFILKDDVTPGLAARATPFTAMLGSTILLWWVVMLVFQGEGLELDLQRRRHPMWEWIFSHPVPPGAVFLAEMLSPIAANPIYWSGPLFAAFLYGFAYGVGPGMLAALLVGVPVTIAAACLGKALEIGVTLRFPPRTRGAMIGFMSWLGYASMMVFFVGAFLIPRLIAAAGNYLEVLTFLPWPWLRLFLGQQSDGASSFLVGMLTCWLVSALTIACSIWFTVWATNQGLTGSFGRADSRPSSSRNGEARFGKEPLYRKEFLWFIRDRSAIVQTILIPLTVAGVQVFNLRGILVHAQGAWNYLCGAGILFGTYFLWILGPKSLASEGSALWIALTWPRGLESLLKAKAWLWSLISTGMVALVLAYAAFLFPTNIWQILLVGVGWFVFGRSMAEKSVTLVTVTSASGETEKIHWGRRWATQLGMFTFAIGVLTQQWHIAIMGIVYSYITAAAMWQNFRARLPYLYDPWSEQLPPAPTLMHAMVAISILVEAGAVFTGIIVALAGRENIGVAMAISYAICAVIVSMGMTSFLGGRGVSAHDVWRWHSDSEAEGEPSWRDTFHADVLFSLFKGAAAGALLGVLALGYVAVLRHLPATAEILRKSEEQMMNVPNLRLWFAIMAIGFAPFAEEYLFRGLLYRALDREWGGWRAIFGSAAFFAVYHSPLSWLPVGLLGATNALLFRNTKRLMPAVIVHMVYNAIVVLGQ